MFTNQTGWEKTRFQLTSDAIKGTCVDVPIPAGAELGPVC